jgi:hypothetical protein
LKKNKKRVAVTDQSKNKRIPKNKTKISNYGIEWKVVEPRPHSMGLKNESYWEHLGNFSGTFWDLIKHLENFMGTH